MIYRFKHSLMKAPCSVWFVLSDSQVLQDCKGEIYNGKGKIVFSRTSNENLIVYA